MIEVREFIQNMLAAVNTRVGFPLFKTNELFSDEKAGAGMEGCVDWRHARKSMEDAFLHLKLKHLLSCENVELPNEDVSDYGICARKLCAAAASTYAPQFPSQEEWKRDGELRKALRCCLIWFVERMTVHTAREMASEKRREESEADSGQSHLFSLTELLQGSRPPPEILASLRDHLLRLEHSAKTIVTLMKSPYIFLAVADAVREIPSEKERESFLERVANILGELEEKPSEHELAALIQGLRGEAAQKPN